MKTLYDRIGGHDGLNYLLHHFYADVRQHQILGPIFNARIQDWPSHLEKIAEFWARQTGGPSRYGGGLGAAHVPLKLRQEHFTHWLQLWDFNCRRNLPLDEAAELSDRAHRIGEQLQRIVSHGHNGLVIGS